MARCLHEAVGSMVEPVRHGPRQRRQTRPQELRRKEERSMRDPGKSWLDQLVELATPWLLLFGLVTLFSRVLPALLR